MTNDIAPELFDKISAEFERLYGGNARIKTLLAKINAGTATYVEAEEYAELVGRTCSASMLRYLGDDVLPDPDFTTTLRNAPCGRCWSRAGTWRKKSQCLYRRA